MSICKHNDSYQLFCCEVSTKLFNKAHLMTNVEFPLAGIVNSDYEKLSQEVWYTFMNNFQSIYNFHKKIQFWNQLNEFMKLQFPQYGLFITGCTLNGFGLKDNYIDMVLLEKSSPFCDRNSTILCFEQFIQCLTKYDDIQNLELVHSLIPTINFYEAKCMLYINLNYNDLVSIRNTYLLYCYSRVDWRVRPLVIIIKLWARNQNINNSRYGTLSSYSLILMVIHFLQYGLKPAILPCLQNLFEYKFKKDYDIEKINFFDQLDISFHPKNKQTLGELLLEFFRYYDAFQFNRFVISVRLGTKIPRAEYQKDRLYSSEGTIWWKYICIEDPIDLTNASKSVYDHLVFKNIKKIIRESYIMLKSTHDLSSILVSL